MYQKSDGKERQNKWILKGFDESIQKTYLGSLPAFFRASRTIHSS